MFGPVNGVHRRIGLAYSTRLLLDDPSPNGLGGDSGGEVARPLLVRQRPRETRGVRCESAGGLRLPGRRLEPAAGSDGPRLDRREQSMGVYGHDNPALPFVALGLTPPTQHDLHDAEKARAIRKLSWALGEAYDARLPLTRRIERENRDPALADSLQQRRKLLIALIPSSSAPRATT